MSDSNSRGVYIIRILQILEKYSNEERPIKQTEIVKKLYDDYGIEIERKAVGRALTKMERIFGLDSPMQIKRVHKSGVYITRLFSDAELKLLADSVLASRHIPEKETGNMVDRLCLLSQEDFKHKIRYVKVAKNYQGKIENDKFFATLDIINTAIEKNKQIRFNYNQIGVKNQYSKLYPHTVSPYYALIHNQHYFLISYDEGKKAQRYFRIDKMSDVEILQTTATKEKDVKPFIHVDDYKTKITAYPYMYTDKPQTVTFWVQDGMLSELVDWFGNDFKILLQEEKRFKISLSVSPMAMKKWALQYTPDVEIITPQDLREEVIQELGKALKTYKKS